MRAFDLVGHSPVTPGTEEGVVCPTCDGDGLLEGLDRLQWCGDCGGRGGQDPDAVARARAFSEAYRRQLEGAQ